MRMLRRMKDPFKADQDSEYVSGLRYLEILFHRSK